MGLENSDDEFFSVDILLKWIIGPLSSRDIGLNARCITSKAI